MGESTKIEWTDHTFNPWIGCSKVHTGCLNCYAEADMDTRKGRAKWGVDGTRSITTVDYWKKPLTWNKQAQADGVRRRVFCASLADVFEAWGDGLIREGGGYLMKPYLDSENCRANWIVEYAEDTAYDSQGWRLVTLDDVRKELFRLIDATPWLDWLLLTKRPGDIIRRWPSRTDFQYIPEAGTLNEFNEFHRDNVWLGTSVSDQDTADDAVPKLLICAKLARFLFLSVEPLVGLVDLTCLQPEGLYELNALTGAHGVKRPLQGFGPRVDWVIVGGESGPQARRCNPDWFRKIVKQCQKATVPVFVKQLGGNIVTRNDMIEDVFSDQNTGWPDPMVEYDINGYREEYQGADCRIRTHDKKGGNPSEWPEDLRIREFPKTL